MTKQLLTAEDLRWIVDPDTQTATVYHSPLDPRVLTAADMLSGEDVMPGFTCRASVSFA